MRRLIHTLAGSGVPPRAPGWIFSARVSEAPSARSWNGWKKRRRSPSACAPAGSARMRSAENRPGTGGLICALILLASAGASEVEAAPHADFNAFATRATLHLPTGWHVAECVFGPQQITMDWGPPTTGLRVRLDGPQLWHPYFYSGPPMTPGQASAYFRDRPESIFIWIVPRSYKPQKDIFVVDLFRPADQQTHLLGSTAALNLYAYGGDCYSWKHWRSDIRHNLRK